MREVREAAVMPYSDDKPMPNSPCEDAMIRDLALLLLTRLKDGHGRP